MSAVTTHVLDTSLGRPAVGVPITLARLDDGAWKDLGAGETDKDGRLQTLLPNGPLLVGTYLIVFDTAAYFRAQKTEGFYATVSVEFVVKDATAHYHVPLLLSPYGYSTYRGS